jgi:hypothetical protein
MADAVSFASVQMDIFVEFLHLHRYNHTYC